MPLLLGGDEFGRSQDGSNNAYCQDNELTWFDWGAAADNADLIEFTARLCRLREHHPVFRRHQFLQGKPAPETTPDDLDWCRPDGDPMTPDDWGASFARAVTMALSGATGRHTPADDPFLLMLNAWWEQLDFSLPESLRRLDWEVELDTADPEVRGQPLDPGGTVPVTARSLVLLRGSAAGGSRPSSCLSADRGVESHRRHRSIKKVLEIGAGRRRRCAGALR